MEEDLGRDYNSIRYKLMFGAAALALCLIEFYFVTVPDFAHQNADTNTLIYVWHEMAAPLRQVHHGFRIEFDEGLRRSFIAVFVYFVLLCPVIIVLQANFIVSLFVLSGLALLDLGLIGQFVALREGVLTDHGPLLPVNSFDLLTHCFWVILYLAVSLWQIGSYLVTRAQSQREP